MVKKKKRKKRKKDEKKNEYQVVKNYINDTVTVYRDNESSDE